MANLPVMTEGIDHTADAPGVRVLDRTDRAGPAATACANRESGSATVKIIRTERPPSDWGLKLSCSGDSSLSQNSAPWMDNRDTTDPPSSSRWKTSWAAKANL
jgi:hypothetical protein